MEQKKRQNNPFNGEFILPGYDTSENGKEWITGRYNENSDDSYDWKFEQKSVLKLLSRNVAYGGLFSIPTPSYPPTQSVYVYCPSENILCINHFECSGDFNVRRDIYKVEQTSETEFWLYPLNDAENEPEYYKFRMKLLKVCWS